MGDYTHLLVQGSMAPMRHGSAIDIFKLP